MEVRRGQRSRSNANGVRASTTAHLRGILHAVHGAFDVATLPFVVSTTPFPPERPAVPAPSSTAPPFPVRTSSLALPAPSRCPGVFLLIKGGTNHEHRGLVREGTFWKSNVRCSEVVGKRTSALPLIPVYCWNCEVVAVFHAIAICCSLRFKRNFCRPSFPAAANATSATVRRSRSNVQIWRIASRGGRD